MLNSGYTGSIEDLFCSSLKTGGNEEEQVVQYEDEYSSSTESESSSDSRSMSPPPRKPSPEPGHGHHKRSSTRIGLHSQHSPPADLHAHARRTPATSSGSRHPNRQTLSRRNLAESPERSFRPQSATWRSPPHVTKRLPTTLMGRPSSALGSRQTLASRQSQYKDAVAPFSELCAVIPGRLSLSIHRSATHTTGQQARDTQRHFFSSDVQDRAHMTVMCVVEFCELIHKKLTDPRLAKKHMVYYMGPSENGRTNAAFLMASYLVVKCSKTAAEAALPFEKSRGFRLGTISMTDKAPQGYDLDLKGCLFGLEKALALGWFQLLSSGVEDRVVLAKTLNMQQLIPNVYVFTSPVAGELLHAYYEDPFSGGGRLYGPDKYIETIYDKNITTIIHLDPPTYDTTVFSGHGVRVVDMTDAKLEEDRVPPNHLMRRFLRLMAQQPHGSSVGIHSKRAMGRVGTLLALLLMEEFDLAAAEAVGWLRLVRPGMVLGVQQAWIASKDDFAQRTWHLKNELMPPRQAGGGGGGEKRAETPSLSQSTLVMARTPSLEQRAVRAAAEALAPHGGGSGRVPAQENLNARMGSVVTRAVSVHTAWGAFKSKANSTRPAKGKSGNRSPASLPSLHAPRGPPQPNLKRQSSGPVASGLPVDTRKMVVHTIEIGSGDSMQTVQWTEVESEESEHEN